MEERAQHRLQPLRHSLGIHHLQVRQVPPAALPAKSPASQTKSYITNSYHVHVSEPIDAFTKLSFEAQFQRLSPGGAISYVEVPNMQSNIDAVLEVMQFIYENIMYAELNTKSDYCQVCGYDGEIEIQEDPDGKLVWTCPQCGNRDQSKMNVARRTCGYIGTNFGTRAEPRRSGTGSSICKPPQIPYQTGRLPHMKFSLSSKHGNQGLIENRGVPV